MTGASVSAERGSLRLSFESPARLGDGEVKPKRGFADAAIAPSFLPARASPRLRKGGTDSLAYTSREESPF